MFRLRTAPTPMLYLVFSSLYLASAVNLSPYLFPLSLFLSAHFFLPTGFVTIPYDTISAPLSFSFPRKEKRDLPKAKQGKALSTPNPHPASLTYQPTRRLIDPYQSHTQLNTFP